MAWTDPSPGGTLDLDVGETLPESVWDALIANLLAIGGTTGVDLTNFGHNHRNAAGGGHVLLGARNSAAFDSTTTTLADVTGLSVTLDASGVYALEATLGISSITGATPGWKVALSGTATYTARRYHVLGRHADSSLYNSLNNIAFNTHSGSFPGGTTHAALIFNGLLVVNAGGTLTVQYAQNNADAANSTVNANSHILVRKIA